MQYIVDVVRATQKICVVNATTTLAASLYDGGETLHSMGKLTLMKRESDLITSEVTTGSQRAACIIVIHEVCSLHRAPLGFWVLVF